MSYTGKYNRGKTPVPHLDAMKRSIRDKLFASSADLNDFLIKFGNNIDLSANQIKNKNAEVLNNKDSFILDTDYYESRTTEINSLEIKNLENTINKTGNEYLNRSQNYKETIKSDFENMHNSFNYDQVILSRLKNKIEQKRNDNDEVKETFTLQKNEETDKIQQYSKMNLDDYANIRFYNQVYIPFDNDDKEIIIFTLKTLPANYRKQTLENWEMGAFHIKLSLRSNNLISELVISSTKLTDKKYGASIISEGTINLGEDLELNVYYNKHDSEKNIYITVKNIKSDVIDEAELASGNLVLTIGFNILIGASFKIPNELYVPIDKTNENLLHIGQAILESDEQGYIGPLNTPIWERNYHSQTHTKMILSSDDNFGETNIYHLSTIESLKTATQEQKALFPNIQYTKDGVSKKDEVCELLIRSIEKLGLINNIVYQCFGYVIIDQMILPIEQLKLTSKNINPANHNFIQEKLSGIEFLLDRRWMLEQASFNIKTNNNILNFPGISIEGNTTFINKVSTNQYTNDSPIRQAAFGSALNAIYTNEAIASNRFEVATYNDFAWWNGKNAKVNLNGYDITILASTKLITLNEPSPISVVVK